MVMNLNSLQNNTNLNTVIRPSTPINSRIGETIQLRCPNAPKKNTTFVRRNIQNESVCKQLFTN